MLTIILIALIFTVILMYKENVYNFLKNVWLFRSALQNHNSFDYTSSLIIFKKSLEVYRDSFEDNSIHNNKEMVLRKINRAIYLLGLIIKDNYYLYYDNSEEALKKENADWAELWSIISGLSYKKDYKFNSYIEDEYDGKDMRGWWH